MKSALIETAAHLCWRENGKLYTNSKETWRGTKNTVFINHGNWADAEVWYNGHLYNEPSLEEELYHNFSEFCRDFDTAKDYFASKGIHVEPWKYGIRYAEGEPDRTPDYYSFPDDEDMDKLEDIWVQDTDECENVLKNFEAMELWDDSRDIDNRMEYYTFNTR